MPDRQQANHLKRHRKTPLGSRRRTTWLSALLISVGAVLLLAAPAMAERAFLSQLTEIPPGAPVSGSLGEPYGIRVDSSDNVWFADPVREGAISEFDDSNNFLSQQTGGGVFGSGGIYVRSLALSKSNGYLYVADSSSVVVDVFDETGSFLSQWSGFGGGYDFVAVDNSVGPTAGNVLVAESGRLVHSLTAGGAEAEFSAAGQPEHDYIQGSLLTGTPAGSFGGLEGIATGPNGNIYVVDRENRVVDEFEPSGSFIRQYAGTTAELFGSVSDAAVDPTSGHVLIADPVGHVVDEFDSSGNYLSQITGVGEGVPANSLGRPLGVAVNSKGFVYITDATNRVVNVFGPNIKLPTVAAAPISNPGKTSVTLNGSVDPNGGGDVIGCHFEYGTSSAYGSSVSCDEPTPYSSPTAVSAELSGLTTETTYHYRLVVNNAGGSRPGPDQTVTPHQVVGLDTDPAVGVLGRSATLEGSFLGSGEDTKYYFEWGISSAYGQNTQAPPGSDAGTGLGNTPLSSNLTDLEGLTTYHFRVVATSNAGVSYGRDRSFTTLAVPTVASEFGVTSTHASNITTTSADLNADVNPQSTGETTYHFEYGPDNSYGVSTTESTSIGSDSTAHPAKAGVAGLTPGATYHFRVVATSPNGSTRGPDQTFTAIPLLPTIDSTSSSGVGGYSGTLEAQINPGFAPTTYSFQYGTSTNYGENTLQSAPIGSDNLAHPAQSSVSELTPGTTYHFRAVATNFAGTTLGPDWTFTTSSAPEVSDALLSPAGQTVATLGAKVNPRGAPTTYHFEYGPSASYGASTPESAPLGADTTEHAAGASISGLVPGTTYHFRVVATNEVGTTPGIDQTFTTAAASIVPIGEGAPPPPSCRKGFVRKHGKCVKKRKRKGGHRRNNRTGDSK